MMNKKKIPLRVHLIKESSYLATVFNAITFCRSSAKLPTFERPLMDGMGACRLFPSTVLPVNVGREYVFGAANKIKETRQWTLLEYGVAFS